MALTQEIQAQIAQLHTDLADARKRADAATARAANNPGDRALFDAKKAATYAVAEVERDIAHREEMLAQARATDASVEGKARAAKRKALGATLTQKRRQAVLECARRFDAAIPLLAGIVKEWAEALAALHGARGELMEHTDYRVEDIIAASYSLGTPPAVNYAFELAFYRILKESSLDMGRVVHFVTHGMGTAQMTNISLEFASRFLTDRLDGAVAKVEADHAN